MNCDEYIANFLSADADNELSAQERHLVEEHLDGCPKCRARLDEELALKASIRQHIGSTRAPADVRLRIRAALGEAVEHSVRKATTVRTRVSRRKDAKRELVLPLIRGRASSGGTSRDEAIMRSGSARRWLAIQLRRAQYLAPIGFVTVLLAASTVIYRVSSKNVTGETTTEYQRSIPAFDFAIGRFNELSEEFAPNVPPEAFERKDGIYFAWVEESNPLRHVSAELPDISASYEKLQMLPEFCDFALAGYELVGGRIDHLPDGEPVTYTLYRDQTSSILSIGLKQRVSAPQGGYWFGSHALYSYRGYSICLTIFPAADFASIIVARTPMVELLRNVATSDITFPQR